MLTPKRKQNFFVYFCQSRPLIKMMQENNNFDTIINTWRRMSGEQALPVTVSMSGDSPDFQLHKKKEEESNLLMPERLKGPIATVASAGSVASAVEVPSEASSDSDEKLLKHDDDKKNPEEAIKEKDYLENNELSPKNPESKHSNSSDKVDSVYNPSAPIKPPLQPEPTWEEEDCGIKCLYYTLQCCDCVLM